jgi:SPW repeat
MAATTTPTTVDRWRDWAMLVLAVWLFISPWVLGFAGTAAPEIEGGAAAGGTTAAWNAWIAAVIVAVLSIAAAVRFAEWEDWVNGILGVWLVVAPWALGFAALTAAAWNHVVVGVLIAALAAWELWDVRRHGGTTTRATA